MSKALMADGIHVPLEIKGGIIMIIHNLYNAFLNTQTLYRVNTK